MLADAVKAALGGSLQENFDSLAPTVILRICKKPLILIAKRNLQVNLLQNN
jgi:hypothetical protein